jgi:nuclear pore complex protein Nup205
MSTFGALEALRALHSELIAVCEHRFENLQVLEKSLHAHAEAFKKLLDKPPRDNKSRTAVNSGWSPAQDWGDFGSWEECCGCWRVVNLGKIKVDDEEYQINEEFANSALQLADEVDLDEMAAAKLLLDADDDGEIPGNSLLERGLIRFHLQREYLLNCMRLMIQLSRDDGLDDDMRAGFEEIVDTTVYRLGGPGQQVPDDQKIVPRCFAAMNDIRLWLKRTAEKLAARRAENTEAIEFSRKALVTQHEILAVILSAAVEKGHVKPAEFAEFINILKRVQAYDQLLGESRPRPRPRPRPCLCPRPRYRATEPVQLTRFV